MTKTLTAFTAAALMTPAVGALAQDDAGLPVVTDRVLNILIDKVVLGLGDGADVARL